MMKNTLRKTVLMAAAVVPMLAFSAPSWAQTATKMTSVQQQLTALEKESGGRLGVMLIDTADNSQIAYRADERFAMCSTSKFMG